jgi:hypothetical protein
MLRAGNRRGCDRCRWQKLKPIECGECDADEGQADCEDPKKSRYPIDIAMFRFHMPLRPIDPTPEGAFRMVNRRLTLQADFFQLGAAACAVSLRSNIDARETSRASQISNKRAALTRFVPFSYF